MTSKLESKIDEAAAELIRLGFLEEYIENGQKRWRLTEAGRARADRDRREEELRRGD